MIYLILFIVSLALTYFVKNHAVENELVAEINERSSHDTTTPHGGGIAIAITWFLGLTYLYFTNAIESSFYFALMVGAIISLISYLDDLFDLSVKVRLTTQALVATSGLYFLGGLGKLGFVFFSISDPIVTNIFAFFMILWFINLYNFIDGIDGYAGSEAVFLGMAGYFLFGGDHFLVLVVAVLGFLVWNWHKAKIFMGDVGSTLLGYNVAIFTIYYTNQEATNFWVWILLFGLFWFDATLTLYRRYKNMEQLSKAHNKHAYQRLVRCGLGHDRVTIYSIFINIVLFIIAWATKDDSLPTSISFAMSIVFLYTTVRLVDSKKGFS